VKAEDSTVWPHGLCKGYASYRPKLATQLLARNTKVVVSC
jgi:hypothetical protein